MSVPHKITIGAVGEKVVVRIVGPARFACAVEVKKTVSKLREQGWKDFVVDLSECSITDSTFLGTLAGLAHTDASKKLVLLNANSCFRDLLIAFGILELFSLVEGECLVLNELQDALPNAARLEGGAKEELKRTSLEAHQVLMAVNPDNARRFGLVEQVLLQPKPADQEVAEMLRKALENIPQSEVSPTEPGREKLPGKLGEEETIQPDRAMLSKETSLDDFEALLNKEFKAPIRAECSRSVDWSQTQYAILEQPDYIRFSVFSPSPVRPNQIFQLSVWAFLQRDREQMLAIAERGGRAVEAGTAGPFGVERGTELLVTVRLAGFEVRTPPQKLYWMGEIANVTFELNAPLAAVGPCAGMVTILQKDIPIAQVHFDFEIKNASTQQPSALPSIQTNIRSIFASYANEDRAEVILWSRGAAAIGVEVFLDVLSLRAGQDWEQRLFQEVPSKDLFCLFWSAHAKCSAWVEKEWRCAFSARGLDYIYPVPLADPRDVPPPKELGDNKHFEDFTRIVFEYERNRRKAGEP